MKVDFSEQGEFEDNLSGILDALDTNDSDSNQTMDTRAVGNSYYPVKSSNSARRRLEEYFDNKNLEKILKDVEFEGFDQ